MVKRRGRGRITAIEALPAECDGLIALASAGLQDRKRDQIEVYREFVAGCQKLMVDSHGELEFKIPSKSSFNRYSISLETLTRNLEETRAIASVIASRFDAEESDDVTLIAAMAINTAIFQVMSAADPTKIEAKEFQSLANALRSATAAMGMSTKRRQAVEAEFAEKAKAAVGAAAKAKGLSAETAETILSQILGVEVKK